MLNGTSFGVDAGNTTAGEYVSASVRIDARLRTTRPVQASPAPHPKRRAQHASADWRGLKRRDSTPLRRSRFPQLASTGQPARTERRWLPPPQGWPLGAELPPVARAIAGRLE